MGAYGKSAAKKVSNKKHRAIRSRINSLHKPTTTGQASSAASRDTQASRTVRVVPQEGAIQNTAGQGVFIAESVRSARIPPSTVRTTVLQPGPSLEPAEEDTAPCHLEPSERSCLQWDATAFRDHTSSCKALPVEPFGTVFQINASLPRLGCVLPPAPVQAPAADLSADEQRYTTLPALEHNTVQLQKGGVLETTTPEEAGSLEAAGAEDASSDEAPAVASQTVSFHPTTKNNGGLMTQLFKDASSVFGKLSSTAAASGCCAAQRALAAGAMPIRAAATATTAAAGLSLGMAVGSAAVVMTAAGFTASAVAPVVESSLIQLPLRTASCAARPVATLFLQPVATATTRISSVGLHAIKMAPAIAANLFPNTTKYIKCKLSASPSLGDLEGDEWLAQRRALLEAAVSDYANSSQDSDVEDSSDEDESDEEGDTDLRDMDSAFQPSAAESPTRRVTREAS
ncbi:g12431 [Coccomyxa viridis]|uniref:G12431 protein n=1 Tax=Coccomyxa viridis TaxID=1274662 RepID=A0ABP1GD07_9CHLO